MSAADGMMLWTGDYLADTQHLSTVQHGAYLLILMAIWRNGGALPADERRLASCAKLTMDKWRKVGREVMELLTVEDGIVTQKRLQQEFKKTLTKIEKRQLAGHLGGTAKSLKTHDEAIANATALPEQNTDYATETKTQTENRKKDSLVPSGDGTATDLFEKAARHKRKPTKLEMQARPYSVDFAEFWEAYPPRAGARDKKEAWVSFQRAVADGTDPAAIIAGAKRYHEEQRKVGHIDTEFIKQAATWLNQCCLEDYSSQEPEKKSKPPIWETGKFAAYRDPKWNAWDSYLRRHAGRPATHTMCTPQGPHGPTVDGWYFETEWPPPDHVDQLQQQEAA